MPAPARRQRGAMRATHRPLPAVQIVRRRSRARTGRREFLPAPPTGATRRAIRASAAQAIRARRHPGIRRPTGPATGVRISRDRSSAAFELNSVQRPPEERGRARRPFSPSRRLESMSARKASNPSAVTSPAATSCQSASSTSLGRRFVPRTMSAKNGAPRFPISSSTSRDACESAEVPYSLRTTRSSASSRVNSETGASFVGRTRRVFSSSGSSAGCSESRPHITSPE